MVEITPQMVTAWGWFMALGLPHDWNTYGPTLGEKIGDRNWEPAKRTVVQGLEASYEAGRFTSDSSSWPISQIEISNMWVWINTYTYHF
jgi:hypothetical protein